jgi:hypothetical protein
MNHTQLAMVNEERRKKEGENNEIISIICIPHSKSE